MLKTFSLLSIAGLILAGCASGAHKARQEQRDKVAATSGLFCEWVNGDKFSDLDVELNIQMARRCDPAKPFSLAPYKNMSDANGILYCCSMAAGSELRGGNLPPPQPRKKGPGPAGTPATGNDSIVEDK